MEQRNRPKMSPGESDKDVTFPFNEISLQLDSDL